MLTYRTNVLFDEEDRLMLTSLSASSNKTIGQLIRHAVRKIYKTKKIKNNRRELVKLIKSGWKYLKHPEIPIDYKALVEDGRKY